MNKELRIFKGTEDTKMRASTTEDGKRIVEGYASVFNHESRLIFDYEGEYKEVIRTGAFDDVLGSPTLDVLLNYNHDNTKILARLNHETGQNTLSLSVDEKGLKYRAELPNTPTGDEVYELISRGDLYENSFAFAIRKEVQECDMTGDIKIRYINKVAGLYDTSIVWKGAYSATDIEIAQRHYDEAKELIDTEENKLEEESSEKLRVTQDIENMSMRLLELGE